MNAVGKLKLINIKMEFSLEKKRTLLDMIAEFLHYGISMHAIFNDILPELYPKGSLRFIINDISDKISNGSTLAQAIRGWYGFKVASIVHSGEESDNLYETLKLAVESLQNNRNYISVFFKKIAYSLIVVLVSFLLLELFSIKVIPPIAGFVADKGMPLSSLTSAYLAYTDFVFSKEGLLILLILIGVIVGVGFLLLFYTGRSRDSLDRLPIFALYRKVIAADLLEQLGFYFKANILLDVAVTNILEANRSRYLKMHGQRIIENLEEGVDNITEAFNTGLFDRGMLLVMLAMGRINRFESKCLDYSKLMQQEASAVVKKTGAIFSGIFMVLAAVNILWSLGAMYMGLSALQ
jgi:type II secretory pathway component PulF